MLGGPSAFCVLFGVYKGRICRSWKLAPRGIYQYESCHFREDFQMHDYQEETQKFENYCIVRFLDIAAPLLTNLKGVSLNLNLESW